MKKNKRGRRKPHCRAHTWYDKDCCHCLRVGDKSKFEKEMKKERGLKKKGPEWMRRWLTPEQWQKIRRLGFGPDKPLGVEDLPKRLRGDTFETYRKRCRKVINSFWDYHGALLY